MADFATPFREMTEDNPPAPDMVNHPAHYVGDGLEVIEVIEAWQLGPHLANAVKYVLRAGRKGDHVTDWKKARWYLQRARDHAVPLLVAEPLPRAIKADWPWPNIGDIQQAFDRQPNEINVMVHIGWIARCEGSFQQMHLDEAIAWLNDMINGEETE